MYSAFDAKADALALRFCAKAEALWAREQSHNIDSPNNIVAAQFLSLGYLGHGRDHSVIRYLTAAAKMGARMGFFGIAGQASFTNSGSSTPTEEEEISRRYTAWGIFNWLT